MKSVYLRKEEEQYVRCWKEGYMRHLLLEDIKRKNGLWYTIKVRLGWIDRWFINAK